VISGRTYRKGRYTFNIYLSRSCIIDGRASAVTAEMNPGSARRHLRRKHTRTPCTGEKRHMFPDHRNRNSSFSLCLCLFPASCPELTPPRRPGSCSRSSQSTCIGAPPLGRSQASVPDTGDPQPSACGRTSQTIFNERVF